MILRKKRQDSFNSWSIPAIMAMFADVNYAQIGLWSPSHTYRSAYMKLCCSSWLHIFNLKIVNSTNLLFPAKFSQESICLIVSVLFFIPEWIVRMPTYVSLSWEFTAFVVPNKTCMFSCFHTAEIDFIVTTVQFIQNAGITMFFFSMNQRLSLRQR